MIEQNTEIREQLEPNESDVFCPDQLLNRCLGKIDFAQRVLHLFLNNLDAEIETLFKAQQHGDLQQLGSTAHRMKGSAANIAAPRLKQLMSDVEQASRSEVEMEIDELLLQVEQEARALKETLADWRASLPVAGAEISSSRVLPSAAWRIAVL